MDNNYFLQISYRGDGGQVLGEAVARAAQAELDHSIVVEPLADQRPALGVGTIVLTALITVATKELLRAVLGPIAAGLRRAEREPEARDCDVILVIANREGATDRRGFAGPAEAADGIDRLNDQLAGADGLATLLVQIFSDPELRAWLGSFDMGRQVVPGLPSSLSSAQDLSLEVGMAVFRRGIQHEVFTELLRVRPGRKADVDGWWNGLASSLRR